MARGSLVSIEPDDRGFWHVNFWEEHPDEEDVPPDAYKTTKIGAPLTEAMILADGFKPDRIAVWLQCDDCSGTGEDAEGCGCCECQGGTRCFRSEDLEDEDFAMPAVRYKQPA